MIKVNVIAHTHWDREWYFTLDGQMSIVEDYLQYFPQNILRFEKLVKAGKLKIGPWYTQPDTFNPKIESIIRNLQYGIKFAKKYGLVMEIGYLPDSFGQNIYLPSIFKDANLKYAVVQRGIDPLKINNENNFQWESPNQKIINTHFLKFGYGPGKFLNSSQDYVNNRLKPILDELKITNQDESIILPCGGDQALVRTHLVNTIQSINQIQNEYELNLTNYENSLDQINFTTKPKICAELYDPVRSRIHRTIHSQRIDLKKLNLQVEKKIIEIFEPLVAVANLCGINISPKLVDEIWQKMFDVHAHDSIGGCNSDLTNQNIINRLKQVEQIVEGQINLIKRKMSDAICQENEILVYNFDNMPTKYFELVIFTKTQNFKLFKGDQKVDFITFKTTQISGGKKIEVTADGEKEISLKPYYQHQINILNPLKFIGYTTLKINEISSANLVNLNQLQPLNNRNTIVIFDFCEINITNQIELKLLNQSIIFGFEMCNDLGDSYDFSFDPNDSNFETTTFSSYQISQSDVCYVVEATYQLEANLVKLKIFINKVNQQIKVVNQFKNHLAQKRIRAMLKTQIKDIIHEADSGFSSVIRNNVDPGIKSWKEQNYKEMPLAIYPFERFIKYNSLVVFNSNSKEYQIDNQTIYLTLMRSVDVLGRDNLHTRPNRASGINNLTVLTPDALLLNQEIEITYFLAINDCGYQSYQKVANTYDYYQKQTLNSYQNRLDRFELPGYAINCQKEFKILDYFDPNLKISSIYTDMKNTYIRLFNPTSNNIQLKFSCDVEFVNLIHQQISKQHFIKAKDYVTLKICQKNSK